MTRPPKEFLKKAMNNLMNIERPKSKQTMPDSAKLVFKGKMFDTYQWDQVGYDGKVHVFEKVKRPDTVVVIGVTEDDQIIMTHQEQPGKQPFMALAGGRVDEGEDPLAAAKRELLEETGYTSEQWELFDALQPISKVEWAVYYFVARGCKKTAEQDLDGAEKVEVALRSYDEFLQVAQGKDFYEEEIRVRILESKLNPVEAETLRRQILGRI
jgi:8-oxo-dGTP pyrophosphatase MutT (NUDIX family)